jgi:6,7-dimethyl-8-ribityllumazine synthase
LRFQGAESEVTFGDLDGTDARIGIIRTRWNDQYVSSIVEGIRTSLKECNVKEENIFETEVPGSFELPLAAKFLAMTGTVDAIVCCGVLIKGDTLHFEYICEAVSSGIMSVGLQTSTPIVFGVLTCLNEEQVKKRSIGKDNHGLDWGKTAVEMALLKNEAVGLTKGKSKLKDLGFQVDEKAKEKKNKVPGFF